MYLIIIEPALVIGFILLTIFTGVVTGILFRDHYVRNLNHEREMKAVKAVAENNVLRAKVEIQEQTFQNISRDIHDDIGQKLSLVNFQLSQSKTEDLKGIRETISGVIQHLRDLSKSLSADLVRRHGLYDAITDDLEQINSQGTIAATLQLSDNYDYLNNDIEVVIYRVYQEAIQNILKHAGATKILVSLDCSNDTFTLAISDNGVGLSGIPSRGQGLTNMSLRAESIGARFNIHSNDTGTHLMFKLPINEHTKN